MNDLPFERTFRRWCAGHQVEWRSIRYARAAAGGETWAHRISPAEPPRGGVLIVHGGGNDALFSLTGLFTRLLERGFEVFSFDVDGHGRASTTRLAAEPVRECVRSALTAWGDDVAGRPLHAIGISLGGSILLHSLPSLSGRVTSAALFSAPLRIDLSWPAMRRELGIPMLRTVWRERGRFGLTGLIPSFGPFRRHLYPLRLDAPPGEGGFGYVEVLNQLLEGLELREAARQTSAPVLLVYGERDLLVPAAQGRTLAELLPASELLVLPGETHLSAPLAPLAVGRLLRWLDQDHQDHRRES